MSTAPLIRYALDPTGTNSDNAVSGEVKDLNVAQIRAVAPTYGPFFADETLVIYDHGNGRLLVRGQDYQCVEMLQDATLKFGKEIAQLVLIINPLVGSQVRLNYQVLGGLYQNNVEGLINMYDTLMLDNRPVDWSQVLNKPTLYPPTLHKHLLDDIYGFEPVVVALERIRNAIVLSDVPAFEALIDWVKSRGLTSPELHSFTGLDKFVTFEMLLEAARTINFNAITVEPVRKSIIPGQSQRFDLTTTNYSDGTVIYWTVKHHGTSDGDFAATSGIINIMSNRGSFNFSVIDNLENLPNKFTIEFRIDSVTGPVIWRLQDIRLTTGGSSTTGNTMMQLLTACCLYNPKIYKTPRSYYVIGDD